jgi:hypothetical protein
VKEGRNERTNEEGGEGTKEGYRSCEINKNNSSLLYVHSLRAAISSSEWLLLVVWSSEADLSQKLYSASICKDGTRTPNPIRRVVSKLWHGS